MEFIGSALTEKELEGMIKIAEEHSKESMEKYGEYRPLKRLLTYKDFKKVCDENRIQILWGEKKNLGFALIDDNYVVSLVSPKWRTLYNGKWRKYYGYAKDFIDYFVLNIPPETKKFKCIKCGDIFEVSKTILDAYKGWSPKYCVNCKR